MNTNSNQNQSKLTLILGGTGKTGKRIATRLNAINVPIRIGSRSATPAFDWNHEAGWDSCLEGIEAVYVNYSPDLAIPGATDSIRQFVNKAKEHGVKKLVLLSGRGEAEAQACEKIIKDSGIDWTIVRASWFFQNFSEGDFIDMVRSDAITIPAGDVQEPFVDVDDIADIVSLALTQDNHSEKLYEVTGPRLMSFFDVAKELSVATKRNIEYIKVPHDAFVAGVKESGAPDDIVWLMDYLCSTVLDGRNAHLTDGVQQALGRAPKDFSDYAKTVAATGCWRIEQ